MYKLESVDNSTSTSADQFRVLSLGRTRERRYTAMESEPVVQYGATRTTSS